MELEARNQEIVCDLNRFHLPWQRALLTVMAAAGQVNETVVYQKEQGSDIFRVTLTKLCSEGW